MKTKNRPKQTNSTRFIAPDAAARPVFVLSDRYRRLETPIHSHRRTQLVHVSEGVLSVTTDEGRWTIPRNRALWIPSGLRHKISSRRPFRLMTLYVEPDLAPSSPKPSIVSIDRLVDELMIAASVLGSDYPVAGPEERLIAVLLDRLAGLSRTTMHLPEPNDRRLKRLTALLHADPAKPDTLRELANVVGLTERTAARLFLAETAMTFGQWRQRLRLQLALEELGAGTSVTETALNVGYNDVSSFITAFKTAFGTTPARLMNDR